MDSNGKKKPMTDSERLELAKKLDTELDEFINRLEKKPYKDGWPEERWEEEMEKHPFFMKKPPEPGEELHPLYEGLQQLKYDPDENTPEELAVSYKEDGNFNFKHKNYRLAILSYTEGIKIKCSNSEIEASLLNNRSAAQYQLKNYCSCLRDCDLALKIKPIYPKVIMRVANCCYATEDYERCLVFCDQILVSDPSNCDALRLRKDCVTASKNKERDARKKESAAKKKLKCEQLLLQEIQKRNINIEDGIESLKLEYSKRIPELNNNRVFLNEDNILVWPVILFYPEYKTLDLIEQFSENDRFIDQLSTVFEERPTWDVNGKYSINNLNMYYEDSRENKIYSVNIRLTLREILSLQTFYLRGGTPSFIVFAKDATAEKDFLKKY